MNAPTRLSPEPQRRVFTVDEVLAMRCGPGVDDGERLELIDGDLVLMPSKLNRHEVFKNHLARAFHRLLPPDVEAWVQSTLYLRPKDAPDPDLMVFPQGTSIEALAPEAVHLVVEVADTTLRRDLGVRATLYARYQVQEYWVIDVQAPRLFVHRRPSGEVWADIRAIGPDEPIAPLAFPEAAIRLADLAP
jgi:Uma2 family endonuclease